MGLRSPSLRSTTLGVLRSHKLRSQLAIPPQRAAFRTSAIAAGPSIPPREPETVLSLFRTRPRYSARTRWLFALGWIPVAAFITSHVCSIGNVTGASMSPTFNGPREEALAAGAGSDVVLLNRSVQVTQQYEVGDIVTLVSPLEPRLLLTKRIIALPGDMVRTWAPASDDAQSSKGKGRWTRIKVPPGHVWIEGDAAVDIAPSSFGHAASGIAPPGVQTKSRDSREFGPVPMGLITSRISYILWPPRRFGPPAPRPIPSTTSSHHYPPSASSANSADLQKSVGLATQVNPSLSRVLDELTSAPRGKRTKAHPQDSILSPFVDWDDEQPAAGEEESAPAAKNQHHLKHVWNSLSRGGRLGDDAE